MGEDKYLIQSIEHQFQGHFAVFWKPNRLGYTASIEEAGRYSKEEAESICANAGPENERMWSERQIFHGELGSISRVVML